MQRMKGSMRYAAGEQSWLLGAISLPFGFPRHSFVRSQLWSLLCMLHARRLSSWRLSLRLLRETPLRGQAPCGLLLTPKSNGLLLVIFDGLPANALLSVGAPSLAPWWCCLQ